MSTETKANVPVTGWTKGIVSVDKCGLVKTPFGGALLVSGIAIPCGPHPQAAEAEANRDLLVETINVATETGLTPRQLAERVETLKREAQIHAMEARAANATITEIYQLCTGATGEPGNWNGAEPVRRLAERLELAIGALLTIADLPIAEQDCMLAANMREVALRAIALTKEART